MLISEIAGVSLEDFGVSTKSRIFASSIDWNPNTRLSISSGYNYNWINSNAVVDYFFNSIRHPLGHSLYFVRNNFFYIDATTQLLPRVTLFAAYRINNDNGQGNRVADPTGTPGTLVTSYPMSFQSPEARLAIKINRRLDWNFWLPVLQLQRKCDRRSAAAEPSLASPVHVVAHLHWTQGIASLCYLCDLCGCQNLSKT
jgi:hypothetical protein